MAIFFYRGPEHFYGNHDEFEVGFGRQPAQRRGMGEAVFYRFIPT